MRKVRRLLKENWIPIVVGILLTKWAVDYAYRVQFTRKSSARTPERSYRFILLEPLRKANRIFESFISQTIIWPRH